MTDVYHSLIPTEADIIKLAGDERVAKWQALGSQIDSAQYALGMAVLEMIELTDELPQYKKAIYSAIAKQAGKSVSSIRQYYYTVRDTPLKLWENYKGVCFSIFSHAARLNGKQETALQYAQQKACSVDEIIAMYPVVEDSQSEEITVKYDYPVYFTRIIREAHLFGKWNQVKPHLDAIKELMKE